MRYVRLIFFISFIIGVSKIFASDMLSAASDADAVRGLPEHFNDNIPWRCPENIKLEYDLKKLEISLEEAKAEGSDAKISEYCSLIRLLQNAIAKWERDSYDLYKKQRGCGGVLRRFDMGKVKG